MGTDYSRLKPEDMHDLRRNTDFTDEEIHEWYKDFLKEYPSGQLPIEEFKILYGKMFPHGDASAFAEHVFRTLDKNSDGALDFKEFLLALYITSHGTLDQKLKWVFTMYDIDGNGYISSEEMLEIVRSVHKAIGLMKLPAEESTPEKRTAVLFRKLNRKMDGRISLEEFIENAKDDPIIRGLLYLNPMK